MHKSFGTLMASSTEISLLKPATNWESVRASLMNEFPFKVGQIAIVDDRGCVGRKRKGRGATPSALLLSPGMEIVEGKTLSEKFSNLIFLRSSDGRGDLVVRIIEADGDAGGRKIISEADCDAKSFESKDGMLDFVPPAITDRVAVSFIKPLKDIVPGIVFLRGISQGCPHSISSVKMGILPHPPLLP